jgi:hypothetical protein
MVKLRKNKKRTETDEAEFNDKYAHSKVVDFHPHCFVQPLALAESRQFDEIYALAHHPVLGENEEEA